MLTLSILYATVAIPLQSLTRIRYSRLGFITLLFSSILSIINFPTSSGYLNLFSSIGKEKAQILDKEYILGNQNIDYRFDSNTFNQSLVNTDMPLNDISKDMFFDSSNVYSLYNDLIVATPMINTIDILLLIIGAILVSPYLSFSSYSIPFYKKEYVKKYFLNIYSETTEKKHISDLLKGGFNLSTKKEPYLDQSQLDVFKPLDKNKINENLNTQEYYIFSLCTILGSIILVSSNDLLILLLGVELQSYSLYIIASSTNRTISIYAPRNGFKSLWRSREPSEAAGLKYYLLGALASSIILLGIGILYTNLGSTNFNTISILFSSIPYSNSIDILSNPIPISINIDYITTSLPFTSQNILGLLLIISGLV
jgi:Proton-conducting membrane transporter